jgi:glycosyltransferase involved in cell wall biosynthesis
MEITVAVTTFNEGEYLDRLLCDLSMQNCSLLFEIVLVEAGDYDIDRARKHLGQHAEKLVFHHHPRLSRTKSLNFIFDTARGDLIVRLDGRSHVNSDYLMDIYRLSIESGAENVGGVMKPIGSTDVQSFIADIMNHPLSFGGAKARQLNFIGFADSVYLGAFRKSKCKYGNEWFDSTHPKISEDSDLNYRIRQNGGQIFVDSSIVVEHYPRENLNKFFRLCFYYGIGRGLFMMKYRLFSAYRQLVPPLSLLIAVFFLILGLYNPTSFFLLLFLITLYLMVILIVSLCISQSSKQLITSLLGFIGCHFFWTAGLLCAPFIFAKDLRNAQ